MKLLARFCPSLVLLAVFVAPAFAQTQYRFELFTGASFPRDKDFVLGQPQFSPPLKGTYHFSRSFRGGLRVGADFRKHWGDEFSYSFGKNSIKINNTTAGTQFPFSAAAHHIAFNLLWYPGGLDAKKKVYPYVTAGVGTTFYVLPPEDVNSAAEAGLGKLTSENIFAFNAGGGVRVQAAKHYGFRVDARDTMMRSPRFGLPESSNNPSALVFPASGVFHQVEVTFAFVYYF